MSDQTDIFQPLAQQGQYAELCTALYERELQQLAQIPAVSATALQKRLASLPFYIQRAARGSLASKSPLALDVQNASWSQRQAKQCPANAERATAQASALNQWLKRHAALGLVLPVWVYSATEQRILLDSVDRVDREQQRVRLNYQGWFSFDGIAEDPIDSACRLIKPDKKVMTAAACGHRWGAQGRLSPTPLSLRELLLVATLDWKGFAHVVRIPE
ncbi:hypothetical protein CWI84_05975 [Idiomarina tyrosinivorans]|uniref:Uncharacterized protein n=1 Tax=Idiomarina tyrosinivorans TaxID=1445662 RepID=A0A432ZRQ3_9GAMM|nr:hypothetical protein [Idiomarina tyrosinivorans]RUO80605.1 hypothetical protein CWI84_05975 [Idiomarina tyrosinivorans]